MGKLRILIFLASLIRVHDEGSRLVPGINTESNWTCAHFFILSYCL